ncbi:MAG: RluA family pseudouridine synthase [Bdellovibrionales bacterium]
MANSKKSQTLNLINETDSIRLDQFLASQEQIASRSLAQKLILNKSVTSQGITLAKSSIKLTEGQIIKVEIPIIGDVGLVAWEHPLDIIFEDSELLIVNKESGLVIHPAAGHETDTLVNALLSHTKDLSMGFGENRPGIVHRIDKETSGLLVVAKNNDSHEFLAKQFQEKTNHRLYWAICYGIPKNSEGRIESEIGRHPNNRKKMSSMASTGSKTAISHYKVIGTYQNELSLVQMKLETGRTHQIRVHLSEMGHPIIGDEVYGSNKRTKNLKSVLLRKEITNLPRFALHAASLGFVHPKTNEELFFYSNIPEDLREIVSKLNFLEIIESIEAEFETK